MSEPLWATQFSLSPCAAGHFVITRELQFVVLHVEDRIRTPFVRIVGTAARSVPPPHSSVNTTFLPSFENDAECQYA